MPERVLKSWVTTARPVVGFAAVLVIAVFLLGALIQATNVTLNNHQIYAIAFISVF